MNRWAPRMILTLLVTGISTAALAAGDHQALNLGPFTLESGITLPNTKLSYVTHGRLNADKSNAILLGTYYGGDHHGYDFLIGPGKALDPTQHFIIVTDMFGNGLSSSPSNTAAPMDGPRFPGITIRDNVRAAHALTSGRFGIRRLRAVMGYSMGAQQALQWAVSYPDSVVDVVAWCGAAREYPQGLARLAAAKTALVSDPAFNGGNYRKPPLQGLKAFGRYWAPWSFSAEWFRLQLHQQLGQATLEEHLRGHWDAFYSQVDANNILAVTDAWMRHDIGDTPGFQGDHEKALAAIRARVLLMPCASDLYFPAEDAQRDAAFIPNATVRPIPSAWGHLAGLGINPADNLFIGQAISGFLEPVRKMFGRPQPVTLRGYDRHAMEPFMTRDGRYLLFNNSNDPSVNTNLHFAERIDDLTFQYRGELQGVNTKALEGVPAMDRDGTFYFVSTRDYGQTLSTIYRGRFAQGQVTAVELVPGVSRKVPGLVNFDVDVSPDGETLYFVDAMFARGAPQTADLVIARRKGGSFERTTDSAAILRQVNSDALEYAPSISADGLMLLFTRVPVGFTQPPAIYVSHRDNAASPFGKPEKVEGLGAFVEASTLSPDERAFYYHRKDGKRLSIYRATR